MAQSGYTPIQLYYSSTTTNVPLAANLAYGELAINITDGKLFYKDNANAIQVIGWKVVPATAGGTGQTSYAVGDLLYANTTTTLAKLADVATGNALISGGVSTAPSWGKIGLTTHVSGTLPTANGGTNLTSFTANGVMYASSTSALATGSALTFDGTNFATTGTATATKFIPTGSSATGNSIFLPAANSVGISTNGSERVRVDQDGNVGVQTTASAWAWPNGSTGTVQLQAYAALSAYNATTYLSNNWYYNAGEKFMANGYAMRYEQTTGKHTWYVSNASNAGGAGAGVTWTTLGGWGTNSDFTLNGGNVVIGTSGKGIDFSATPGTGTSELLADYEEGTYTATLTTGSGSITVNSSFNTLAYTKIGRMMYVTGYITASSVSAPSGFLRLNLPSTITNLSQGAETVGGQIIVQGSASGVANGFSFIGSGGNSYVSIYISTGNALADAGAQILTANATDIYISLFYVSN